MGSTSVTSITINIYRALFVSGINPNPKIYPILLPLYNDSNLFPARICVVRPFI